MHFYDSESKRITLEFEAHLASKYASDLPIATHSAIWDKASEYGITAWEEGNSFNFAFDNIEIYYAEIVEFSETLFAAVKK